MEEAKLHPSTLGIIFNLFLITTTYFLVLIPEGEVAGETEGFGLFLIIGIIIGIIAIFYENGTLLSIVKSMSVFLILALMTVIVSGVRYVSNSLLFDPFTDPTFFDFVFAIFSIFFMVVPVIIGIVVVHIAKNYISAWRND